MNHSFFPLFSSYIYHLVDSAWALTHTTLSVLRDFAADGVVYLELRTTPRAIPQAGLTKSDYVATILSAIQSFEKEDQRLRTKLILSIDRRNTLPEALEVVELCRSFRGRGVVGLDLCGDPKRGGIEVLTPAFELAKRDMPGLGLTLHFAEAEESGTEEELDMLLDWAPGRIGHVIHVPERVRERIRGVGGMGLELCLSCNVHAGMITGGFEAHHFGEWWRVKECVVALSVGFSFCRGCFTEADMIHRQMMLVCLGARCRTSMPWSPNISDLSVQRFVSWLEERFRSFLEARRRRKDYGVSCGRSNGTQHFNTTEALSV